MEENQMSMALLHCLNRCSWPAGGYFCTGVTV